MTGRRAVRRIPVGGAVLALAVAALCLIPAGTAASARPSEHPSLPGRSAGAAPAGPRPAGGGSPYVTGATTLASIPVKSQPTVATFDPSDDDLYVQNFGVPILGGNTESIVDDTNGTVLTTVPVGDDPLSSVYANASGNVYVMNFGHSNNLTVFHGLKIIAWIPTGITPIGGVYDPSNDYVYVVDQSSDNLTVLDNTTTVGSVPVGSYPGTAVYDPSNGWIYVPNAASNNVTIVNGSAGAGLSSVGSVTVGAGAVDAVYDSDNGWVYVPNPGSASVTVLNGTAVVATVRTGVTPTEAGYDAANGWVYVTDPGTNSVFALNGTTVVGNVSVGTEPRSVVYDAADEEVYVPVWSTNDVTVLNGTSVVATVAVGSNPYGAVYDPHAKSVFVSNFNTNNLSRIGTPSPSVRVTFHQTGLPPGTPWTVDWNATEYPVLGSNISFPSGPGTFNYTLGTIASYSASPANGRTTVTSVDVTVNVSFEAAYAVTFNETGLANGTFWSVTIGTATNGTGNDSLQLWEPNGSYSYRISPLAGYTTAWTGNVTVAGLGVPVAVTFDVPTYSVWFNETGLPAGTLWGATLGPYHNTSSTASVRIDAVNGTYSYELDPVSGFLGVPDAGRVSVTGTFVNVRTSFVSAYAVNFGETGLPAGTNWTVTLGTGPISTTLANQSVVRPNGTYAFSVSTSDFNYVPVTAHGSFNVTGGPVEVPVAFETRRSSNSTFWMTFGEAGLPRGTRWSVTLGTATNTSTTATVGFLIGNATYAFNVSAPEYLPSPSNGLVVANGPASVATPITIDFTAEPVLATLRYPVEFTDDGLPSSLAWTVSIGATSVEGAGHALTIDEPNGTYTYGVTPPSGYVSNGSGRVTVDGSTASVFVLFHPFESRLEFREVGLPTGTVWNVTVGTTTNSTPSAELVLLEPNGTFPYTVGSVPGYVTPSAGTVSVNGTVPTIVEVTYVATTSATGSTVFGVPAIDALGVAAAVAVGLVVLGLVAPARGRPPRDDEPSAGAGSPSAADSDPGFEDLPPGDPESPEP